MAGSIKNIVSAALAMVLAALAMARQGNADSLPVMQTLQKARLLADSQPQQALSLYEQAEEQSRQLNYQPGVAEAKMRRAAMMLGNNLPQSITLATQALQTLSGIKPPQPALLAETQILLAGAYEEMGLADSSAYYYYKTSNDIEQGTSLPPALAVDLYTKLAIFFINQYYGAVASPQYRQTLQQYVERARNAAAQLEDDGRQAAETYFLMGAYHTALQQYDSSRFYYLAYIKDRQERKRLSWRRHVGTLVNIAESYLQQNQPEPALQYLQQAITILESPQIKPYAAYYLHFSNLMVGKALLLQKQYAKSRQVTEYALLQMPATGQRLRMEIADAYNTVAMACEALGDVPAALHYKNLYVQLHDSLLKKEQLDRINALEVRYRLAEKERVLAESQLKITQTTQQVRTRNLAIALFASIMALGLALLILWRRRQIHQQRLQNAQVEAIQKNLEIERLKAGMEGEEMERSRIARDLHDGIGGLLSAAKMNLELVNQKMGPQAPQDLREGITLVQEAASELRKTAHNLMPQILLTDGLAKAIEGYAKRLIGQRSIAFTMQVLGNPIALPPDMEFSLFRILQELVHNIVKHAKATEALVQINYSNGQVLDITVEDNGGGFDLNAQKQGMGLQNIQQRVSLLGGHLDVQSSFGRGTSIYLEFALYAHNLHAATQ